MQVLILGTCKELHCAFIMKMLCIVVLFNPIYRHSEEVIKILETARLGFYVRDTQQKLGEETILFV